MAKWRQGILCAIMTISFAGCGIMSDTNSESLNNAIEKFGLDGDGSTAMEAGTVRMPESVEQGLNEKGIDLDADFVPYVYTSPKTQESYWIGKRGGLFCVISKSGEILAQGLTYSTMVSYEGNRYLLFKDGEGSDAKNLDIMLGIDSLDIPVFDMECTPGGIFALDTNEGKIVYKADPQSEWEDADDSEDGAWFFSDGRVYAFVMDKDQYDQTETTDIGYVVNIDSMQFVGPCVKEEVMCKKYPTLLGDYASEYFGMCAAIQFDDTAVYLLMNDYLRSQKYREVEVESRDMAMVVTMDGNRLLVANDVLYDMPAEADAASEPIDDVYLLKVNGGWVLRQ